MLIKDSFLPTPFVEICHTRDVPLAFNAELIELSVERADRADVIEMN